MSVLSDVQICNLALDAVGARATIVSLQENSKEARACARQYAPALASVLQAAYWNFARKQASLSLLQDATATPAGAVPPPWLYEYAYPSDCVSARYIMPMMPGSPATVVGTPASTTLSGQPVRFLVSSDVDASNNAIKVILTNQPNALLVYTAYITDTGMFDEQFTRAFANYLGHLICMGVSGDKQLSKMAYDIAKQTCVDAQASNGNEGLTIVDNTPDWIRARGYAGDWAYPDSSFTDSTQSLVQVS